MQSLQNPDYIRQYNKTGYTIIRDFFTKDEIAEIAETSDRIKAEGLKHAASFRHKNLLYLIQPDPNLGKVLRFCQWPSYHHPVMEKYRTDERFLKWLQPLLGDNIKQIINQIIWKTPGARQTTYGFHQDARFRRPESAYREIDKSYIQTAIAIDQHTEENGCMVFIEGSHKLGNLRYHNGKSVFEEDITDEALKKMDLGHLLKISVILEPGDLAMWHPYLLHGSGTNRSSIDRRAYLNGYVKAENCDRGEWAFRNGEPVPLGEPVLVQYEDLHSRPEPHYIQGAPHPFKKND